MSTFNPTPAELALTSTVFSLADTQRLGVVTGDNAVKVLSGANLSHSVLGEIWAIADKENNGFLTRNGVAIALRLIGHAQNGEQVKEDLVNKLGPLPRIDGVPEPRSVGSPAPPAPKSSPSRPSPSFPPLTSQDKAKFLRLFIGCGPVNGILSGEKARDVFIKSKLPYENLSQIWTLADTQARGSLDSTDFIIGMYLIQASMSSPGFTLPSTLPAWISEQASQNDISIGVTSHATGGSASGIGSPVQGSFQVPRQHTGSGPASLGSSIIRPNFTGQSQTISNVSRQTSSTFSNTPLDSSSISSSSRGIQVQTQPWDVTAAAKSNSDKFFDTLDGQGRGYIEGDVAVPFMLGSKLPEEDLARIWDVADLHKNGRLTRDGFAVAMHLINLRLTGAEIPTTLPPALVPPAMRQFPAPVMGTVNEFHQDLLGDDTLPAPSVQPEPTGGSQRGPSSTNTPVSNNVTGPGGVQNFAPPSRQSSAFLPAVNKDLLGDDDDEPVRTSNVPDNSAEIGNLRNQISSTTRSYSTTQSERISVEQAVSQQASQLSQLQTQLSAAKASYETESRLLTTLRERLGSQRAEIQKAQEDLIRAESDLSATRVEKAEIEGSVLRDKEEIRDLQRKMKDSSDETNFLKSSIEKLKKDARQQKGLLAIAKKQLATAEAEKGRVNKELEEAQKELDTLRQENADLDAPAVISSDTPQTDLVATPVPSTIAAGVPLPDTPHSVTPRLPTARHSTNPFERLATSTAFSGAVANASVLTSFPSNEPALEETAPSSDPDPFGLSAPSSEPFTEHSGTSAQTPLDADRSLASHAADASPLVTADAGLSSPATTLSEALFLTPQSTASPPTQEAGDSVSKGIQSVLTANPLDDHTETPLNPLQEVENDESDTSDSDDEPLGSKIVEQKTDQPAGSETIAEVTVNKEIYSDAGLTNSPHPTFGDSFGGPTTPPAAKKTSPPTSGKSSPRRSRSPGGTRTLSSHSVPGGMDTFGASAFSQTPLEPPDGEIVPPPTIETVLEPNASPVVTSNISDFDEAFGKIPTPAKDPAPAFKFDAIFDDNFDFSSVNGNVDTSVPLPNEHAVETANSTAQNAFPAFPPMSQASPPQPPNGETSTSEAFVPKVSAVPTANGNSGHPTSFDDAFGFHAVGQPQAREQTPASLGNGNGFLLNDSTSATKAAPQEPPAAVSQGNPFPPQSPPAVPPGDSGDQSSTPSPEVPSTKRPTSPQQSRAASGTIRPSSPPPPSKVRSLSGSKSENKPEGSSKHKLSIRFPFGRKDKVKDKEEKRAHAQAQQPVLEQSQQFLSPVSEPQLPRIVSPAVDDDVEPVKQLSAMGFSRTQSIAALEAHGYDVQKALNSLLGAT